MCVTVGDAEGGGKEYLIDQGDGKGRHVILGDVLTYANVFAGPVAHVELSLNAGTAYTFEVVEQPGGNDFVKQPFALTALSTGRATTVCASSEHALPRVVVCTHQYCPLCSLWWRWMGWWHATARK